MDGSSRPHHSPRRLALGHERAIADLRRQRNWAPGRIAVVLGPGRATSTAPFADLVSSARRVFASRCCATNASTLASLVQHHLHFLRQSQGIIRLAEKYGEMRLDAACQRAPAHGNPHYRTIKTILEKGLEPHPAEPTPPAIASVGAYLHGPEALLGMIGPVPQEIPA